MSWTWQNPNSIYSGPASAADRGVWFGGSTTFPGLASTDTIDYFDISTLGDAVDFGNLTTDRYSLGACSNGSTDRACAAGGQDSGTGLVNIIDYITVSSTGDATDFGDLNWSNHVYNGSCSNGTNDRGIFFQDLNTSSAIDYITISSAGNATDFGDGTNVDDRWGTNTSNDTSERGVVGCLLVSGSVSNIIEYITINSAGNTTDFGDLTVARANSTSCSNGTNDRGVFAMGWEGFLNSDVLDYITISSTGNATDFGDAPAASVNRRYSSGLSSKTSERGVFSGNIAEAWDMHYITINSTGNSQDFGDLSQQRVYMTGASNS